jgi:hypothetical protein
LRNIFAHETGAYFVSCYAGRFNDAEVFDPLGYSMVKSTNYHYSIVTTLNLDYKICHLDGNREKFAAAKRKYGSEVTIHDNGYIGTIILRSESPDRTAEDIVKEFDMPERKNKERQEVKFDAKAVEVALESTEEDKSVLSTLEKIEQVTMELPKITVNEKGEYVSAEPKTEEAAEDEE